MRVYSFGRDALFRFCSRGYEPFDAEDTGRCNFGVGSYTQYGVHYTMFSKTWEEGGFPLDTLCFNCIYSIPLSPKPPPSLPQIPFLPSPNPLPPSSSPTPLSSPKPILPSPKPTLQKSTLSATTTLRCGRCLASHPPPRTSKTGSTLTSTGDSDLTSLPVFGVKSMTSSPTSSKEIYEISSKRKKGLDLKRTSSKWSGLTLSSNIDVPKAMVTTTTTTIDYGPI